MKTSARRLLFWSPRVLSLFFIAFISMFALDVFNEHTSFWNVTRALLMHLIPSGILLLILALSWRWEWVGGVVFTGLALFYLIAFWGRFHWSAYAVISGSLMTLGLLFLLNWNKRAQLRLESRLRGGKLTRG